MFLEKSILPVESENVGVSERESRVRVWELSRSHFSEKAHRNPPGNFIKYIYQLSKFRWGSLLACLLSIVASLAMLLPSVHIILHLPQSWEKLAAKLEAWLAAVDNRSMCDQPEPHAG